MITGDEYQKRAAATAVYPQSTLFNRISYVTLGLVGEAGEVANKVKKIYRDDNSTITPDRRGDIMWELGDVVWYVAQLCTELHLSLEDVMKANLDKLATRDKLGTIHGDQRGE